MLLQNGRNPSLNSRLPALLQKRRGPSMNSHQPALLQKPMRDGADVARCELTALHRRGVSAVRKKVVLNMHRAVQDVKDDDRITARLERMRRSDCSVNGYQQLLRQQ